MKKTLILAAALMVATLTARAAFVEETFVVTTNAVVFSDAIPIAGTLDKVEIIQTSGVTNSIEVGTYSGTTVIDKCVDLTNQTGNEVVRPRVIGTTTAGVDLAAAVIAGGTNTVGTVLVAQYERPYITGNVRAKLTANAANGTKASTVTLRFYFTRN